MEIILINIDSNCYLCGTFFKHKRRVNKFDNEVTIIAHCVRCRRVLARKRALEIKLLDVEWMLFGLQHHPAYFDDD